MTTETLRRYRLRVCGYLGRWHAACVARYVCLAILCHHLEGTSCDPSHKPLLGAAAAEGRQEVALWAWTTEMDTALQRRQLLDDKMQYHVAFNAIGANFVTTGPDQVRHTHPPTVPSDYGPHDGPHSE